MGIGQHYIQAAWVGKEFTYNGIIPNQINSRNNEIQWINPNEIFKLENISREILELKIKRTTAANIFSSGNIIDLDIERELKVNDIEHSTKNDVLSILNMTEKDVCLKKKIRKFYDQFLPFLALHESRTIAVFNYYLKLLQHDIENKQCLGIFVKAASYIKYLEHNKKIWNQLSKDYSEILNTQEDFRKKLFISSTANIFNYLYPKIYKEKLEKYKNIYQWEIYTIENKNITLGLSEVPVLDFSEQWTYSAIHYPILRDMDESLKKLFLNSVFSVISKNKIIWGG